MARVVDSQPACADILGECLALRVRQLDRRLSRLYDDELRGLDLKGTQLSLLVAIGCQAPVRPADLCCELAVEKSTLSRNVARLVERGWVEVAEERGRERPLKLTAAGRALIVEAWPHWRRAQERARELLGVEAPETLRRIVEALPPET